MSTVEYIIGFLGAFSMDALYYLREMLIIGVPAAIVFACFWPYRRNALRAMGLRTNLWRETGLLLFVLCLFGVLAVTLWPVYGERNQGGMWGDFLILCSRPSPWTNVNLIPGRMFLDYWEDLTSGDGFFTVLNFLGNLVVFMPLGFFPALLFRSPSWRRSALVGLGTSVLVEAGQYFVMRTTDIDDVILNTLGALCGFWLYLLLRRLAPRFTQHFQVEVQHGRETGDRGPAPGAGAG